MLRILKENNKILNEFKVSSHFKHGFFAGFCLIFVSGFFDKIFLLNMIYVSINNFIESLFIAIFIGEFMNVLNLFIGKSIPHFINKEIIDWIGITIFFIFGIELLTNGITMKNKKYIKHYKENKKKIFKSDDENIKNMNKNTKNEKNSIKNDEETQALNNYNEEYIAYNNYNIIEENIRNSNDEIIYQRNFDNDDRNKKVIGVFDSWWKYFLLYLLNFLGEKAQITTIIIANKYNFKGLFIGTSCAILLNSIISILIGKSIATILTTKQISILTGILFLCFSAIFLVEKFSYNK